MCACGDLKPMPISSTLAHAVREACMCASGDLKKMLIVSALALFLREVCLCVRAFPFAVWSRPSLFIYSIEKSYLCHDTHFGLSNIQEQWKKMFLMFWGFFELDKF